MSVFVRSDLGNGIREEGGSQKSKGRRNERDTQRIELPLFGLFFRLVLQLLQLFLSSGRWGPHRSSGRFFFLNGNSAFRRFPQTASSLLELETNFLSIPVFLPFSPGKAKVPDKMLPGHPNADEFTSPGSHTVKIRQSLYA